MNRITASLIWILIVPLSHGASLSIGTNRTSSEGDPIWYAPDYGFDPLYWNRGEIPVEKRIAVLEHNLARLKFTKEVLPELEQKIDIRGEKLNIPQIVELIGKKIGKEIPVEFKGDASITHDFDIEGYPIYVIVEAFAIGSGEDIFYQEGKMQIRPAEPGD